LAKGRRAADRRRQREQAVADEAAPDEPTRTSLPPKFDPNAETKLGGEGGGDLVLNDGIADTTGQLDDMAEVTAISDAPRPEPRYGGRVVVLSGPDEGEGGLLELTPAIVGRVPDCELTLTDAAVSRRHIELRFSEEDGSWVLEDLNSSSGTTLNGEMLGMPTEVKHGDVIGVGQTELRFFSDEQLPAMKAEGGGEPTRITEVTRAAPRDATQLTGTKPMPPPKKKKSDGGGIGIIPIIAAVLAGLFVIFLAVAVAGYFVFVHGRSDPAQAQVQVESLVADAQRLLEEGELEKALAAVEAALALDPTHLLAQSLRKTLRSEIDAKAALDEARRLFESGDVEGALKALKRIPDTSRFKKQRDELYKDYDELQRSKNLREIEALVEAGEFDEARRRLEEHLKRWPDDAFASAMLGRIDRIQNAAPADHPAVARAKKAFARGDAMEARIIVEQAAGARPAQRYLADLDRYEQSLARGKRRIRAKDKAALGDMEDAWTLASRLAGAKKSPAHKSTAKPLADALYLQAIADKQRGRECEWAKKILRASQLQPRDRKLAAQKRGVDSKAKAGLTRARALKGEAPARSKQVAREHLCFASPSSKNGKALKKLTR
jgi:tetratricopeptide (TPR) repeat protein